MKKNKELTTEDHAKLIAESVINGQKKQALDQFERALFDHCRAGTLLADIANIIGEGRTLIYIAAAYIEKEWTV